MKLKKIILICVLISFIICTFSACSSVSNRSTQPNNVSEGYITLNSIKYEKARFEKFNSPASKNGLAGTNICVEGKLVYGGAIDAVVYGYIELFTGEEWLVKLCSYACGDWNDYYSYINKEVTIYGYYEGFSETEKKPVIIMDEMHIAETSEIVYGYGITPEIAFERVDADKIPQRIPEPRYDNLYLPEWVRWNMSINEVKDVCNKIISHERSQGDTTYLTFDSHRLDTYDYENVCVFHDKNLFSYFIPCSGNVDTYDDIRAIISQKYGDPISDKEVWNDDTYKSIPEKRNDAFEYGYVSLTTIWKIDKSTICLTFDENNKTLAYYGISLGE